MNRIRTLLRCLLWLMIAVIISAFIIEDDAWLKQRVEKELVTYFEKTYDCSFTARLHRVRLLTGLVELQDVAAESQTGATWLWHAPSITLHVSWWKLFFRRMVSVSLNIPTVTIDSGVHTGRVGILEHLEKLVAPPGSTVSFELKLFEIQKGVVKIALSPENYIKSTIIIDATTLWKKKQPFFVTHVSITGGEICRDGTVITQQCEGKIIHEVPITNAPDVMMQGTVKILMNTPDYACIMGEGIWKSDEKKIVCTTPDKSLALKISAESGSPTLSIQGTLPVGLMSHILVPENILGLGGSLQLHATVDPYAWRQTITGSGEITHLQSVYKHIPDTVHGVVTVGSDDKSVAGTLTLLDAAIPKMQMDWNFDMHNILTAYLKLTDTVALPQGWYLENGQLTTTYDIHHDIACTIQTEGLLKQYQTQKEQHVKGAAVIDKDTITVQAASESYKGSAVLQREPQLRLLHAQVVQKNNQETKTLFDYALQDTTHTCTFVYDLLSCIEHTIPWKVQGEGVFGVTWTEDPADSALLNMKVSLQDASIRIPLTYNIIQSLAGTMSYDTRTRCLRVDHLQLALYKGTADINHAVVNFNKHYGVEFLCVPLVLKSCFISLEKDLFALFSGSLTARYAQDKGMLQGTIVIDKAHIQSNILSQEFKDRLMNSSAAAVPAWWNDIAYDVHILTRSLLQVKTPFLETALRMAVDVEGTVKNPVVSGTLDLVQGSFLFPYKPLFIKQGTITLLPQQLDDPTISLVAENVIRRSTVRMTIDGTVNNPTISFDATPSLEKEQIIGLLLGGSEDGSLYLAMPSSVTGSLNSLIFGPTSSASQVKSTLQTLFSPLKNVRLVPSFSDQSGRGGLRGALSIEMNDRLRATIERNFSLTEDLVFAVDYAVSDDVNMRITRDERSDLGGELEARWKF